MKSNSAKAITIQRQLGSSIYNILHAEMNSKLKLKSHKPQINKNELHAK